MIKAQDIGKLIENNSYVGRGIAVGKTPNAKSAVCAYFIMGRSENSRNRVFTVKNGEVFTEPFDESKVEDPSLIIYAAVRKFENKLIVTNGDQTDTIYDSFKSGKHCTRHALFSREFEPDCPNFTPRISAVLNFENGDFDYEMSILKSADEKGSACSRYFFSYPSIAGEGSFIHTYVGDGNPLPSFEGEPEKITIDDDIDLFTNNLWKYLNEENKISLYVRYTDLETGEYEERVINKNK